MADSKVETISRLAQCRIENFGPCSYIKSEPFKLGIWNWHFSIEKNRYLYIRLFPEQSRLSKEQPPLARFVLRISSSGNGRQPYISPDVCIVLETCYGSQIQEVLEHLTPQLALDFFIVIAGIVNVFK